MGGEGAMTGVDMQGMSQQEAESIITAHGWFRLKMGWYHVDAWAYAGWYDCPRCWSTALEVIEKEFDGFLAGRTGEPGSPDTVQRTGDGGMKITVRSQ
jgi:hypothetical protein